MRPGAPSSLLASADPRFNVADEISDDLDPVRIIIRDLQPAELVLDHDHQFKKIKPVGPEIFNEMRVVGDTFDVHGQVLGNESADPNGIKAVFRSRCSLHRW